MPAGGRPYWEFTLPPVNATLEQSAAWFARNFDYQPGAKGAIRLRTDHQLRARPLRRTPGRPWERLQPRSARRMAFRGR